MQLHAIMQLNCSRGYSGLHNTDEKDKDLGKTEMHSSEKPLLWGCSGAETKTAERVRKTYIDHTVEITSLETPPKNPSLIFPCINDLAPSYCSSISNTWKAKQFQFFCCFIVFLLFSLILVHKV